LVAGGGFRLIVRKQHLMIFFLVRTVGVGVVWLRRQSDDYRRGGI
jgi:hypothetical protein